MNNSSIPLKWHNLIKESLTSQSSKDKIFALDFLSQSTSLSLDFCKEIMPCITQAVLSPDRQVRDYARQARNHILDTFSEIDIHISNSEPFDIHIKEGEKLTAKQILLHKLRLKSRYVVFEAMDRLTESGDSTLVEPLIEYLKNEKDEYKISYLLKLMGRFNDERIPDVLVKYLTHEDKRIVVNALEALCEFKVPSLSSVFADFAMSNDNKIRCNAVRGLYRYSPNIAEKHISEMVRSKDYSLQDSGVFLLRVLRPSNLKELLNIANNSKYADIRLKALDIVPPSEAETKKSEMILEEYNELPDSKRDLAFFAGFIILSACLFVITNQTNRYMLALLFVGISILTVIRPDKTRTSIQKTAISMGFISSIIMGSTRLMLIPSLMGLWLTWIGEHFNHRGKLEKNNPEYIFAWFFSMTSILVTQFIQENYEGVLRLAGNILHGPLFANTKGELYEKAVQIISRQSNFQITIYIFIAVMTISIMTIDRWFPKKETINIRYSPIKRLILVSILFFIGIIILNVFHVFGLQIMLQTNGFNSATDVLKMLLP